MVLIVLTLELRVVHIVVQALFDNDAYVIYELKSDDLDTSWAITETWNEAITVKTVIGE
jgi:hypothetical protein